MALFKKGNTRKDHTDVGIIGGTIYWEPSSNTELVWKYPSNKIKKGAKLQVHDSQEAALFINGSHIKTFHGGGEAYTIDESANIPLLDSVLNFATGGEPVYFAEIWFVNVGTSRKISWFADENNGFKFPANNTIYEARMVTDCIIKIINTELFLKELIGKTTNTDADAIEDFFKSNLVSATVSVMLSIYSEMNIPFHEFIGKRDILQSKLELKINEFFCENYGIEASMLAINRFFSPDLEKFWEAQKKNAILSELGVNYAQERQMDIMQTAAANEGGVAGSMMGAGMGLGAGFGMGNMMGSMMNGMPMQPTPPPPPMPPQTQYYYSVHGQQMGPVDITVLPGLISQNIIQQSTLVWKAGMPQWVNAGQIPELSHMFQATPPPMPFNQ